MFNGNLLLLLEKINKNLKILTPLNNVTPLEHRHRLVTGHSHDDTGVDTRFPQIRDARMSEVMKVQAFHGKKKPAPSKDQNLARSGLKGH
jgi:hypothetical protein